ncbi:MAG: thiamine phosphate synthase [Acidobacteriota bacterium]|nr:thiamine phosphate synthase [Acidobacteriota bacterium]
MPPRPRPQPSLSLPRLYAIVDGEACARAGRAPLDVARAFLSAGVRCMQLRMKGWDSGPFLDLARPVVDEANRAGCTVFINDRADIAALSAAHGLHVGQADLSPSQARRILGPATAIGLSTHTEAQWELAVTEPIAYLAIGPVYGTGTKATGYEAVGLEVVRAASTRAAAAGLPVVAIGGITLARAPEVIASGAASVAVISDLLSGSPEARARDFLRALA